MKKPKKIVKKNKPRKLGKISLREVILEEFLAATLEKIVDFRLALQRIATDDGDANVLRAIAIVALRNDNEEN